ncbi:MAG: hypothetical protein ACU0BB_01300 [Paracoccaceae bacterium]|jgi:hypothetical protein
MKIYAAITSFILLSGAVEAGQTNLHCAIKGGENKGWVPSDLFLSVDYGTQGALVMDGLIAHYYKEPLKVAMKPLKNGTFRIKWTVDVKDATPAPVRIDYDLRLDPKSNGIKLSGRFPLANATNRIRGKGVCSPVTGDHIPRATG